MEAIIIFAFTNRLVVMESSAPISHRINAAMCALKYAEMKLSLFTFFSIFFLIRSEAVQSTIPATVTGVFKKDFSGCIPANKIVGRVGLSAYTR